MVDDQRTEIEAELSALGAPQILLRRCGCGCRFRWPENARRHEIRTTAGEIDEVLEFAPCPQCKSTLTRCLAEPWPRVYVDDREERFELTTNHNDIDVPRSSCRRLIAHPSGVHRLLLDASLERR